MSAQVALPGAGRVEERIAPPPWTALAVLVAIKVAGTMAFAGRYGWNGDELYFLAATRHLSLGYVDFPPITPLIGAFDQLIFSRSLPGFRLPAVLAGSTLIVVAALIARALGGNRMAQALAGLAVLLSPLFIASNLLFHTVTFDQLMWALTTLVFVRLLTGADQREWLLLGVIFGVGLETKYTIIGLGLAMLLALLLTPQRRILAGRWPWMGLAIAIVLLIPNLVWQAGHHWDSVGYTIYHRGTTSGPFIYLLQQLLLGPGLVLLPILIMGVIWLWRDRRLRPAAILVIAVEILFIVVGGKSYYPAPIYLLAYAAGSIWFVGAIRRRWLSRVLIALPCLYTLVFLPLLLPLYPVSSVTASIWETRTDFAAMIGWPEFTQQVTQIYQRLPSDEQQSTVVLAQYYEEAGALQFYGRDLPTVVSPHLTYYYWAPAEMAPSTMIVVGYDGGYLRSLFGNALQVGAVRTPVNVHNDFSGTPIWLIRNPTQTLSHVWFQLKSFD